MQPISVNNAFGVEFLNAVEKIRSTFKGIHTMCRPSKISYGLPNCKYLNQTFMNLAIAKGLDGAIINPLGKRMMASTVTAKDLVGCDAHGMDYLKAHREGQFEFN